MRISERLRTVPVSGIRKMFDLAASDSINLSLGEPDLPPPADALEGMNDAAMKGQNGYGPTPGIMRLREAVAERYSDYGVKSDNVMITPSGTSALMTVTQSIVDTGDETLIPNPGFVVYGPHTILSSGRPVEYTLTDDFQPDIDDIQRKITKRTKAIFLNYPSNPTGGVLSESSLRAVRDIANDKKITVVSDEVYEPFVYDDVHRTFVSELDNAIVVNSFSKMMAVTGWRIGFIISRDDVIPDITKMQYHMCACPSVPAQYGILNAMPAVDQYLNSVRNTYKKRRNIISSRINEIEGLSMKEPRGAFYAFPSFSFEMTSEKFAMELVRNGLVCVPGSAFGTCGEGHLRFSYAADERKICIGMNILEKVANELRG